MLVTDLQTPVWWTSTAIYIDIYGCRQLIWSVTLKCKVIVHSAVFCSWYIITPPPPPFLHPSPMDVILNMIFKKKTKRKDLDVYLSPIFAFTVSCWKFSLRMFTVYDGSCVFCLSVKLESVVQIHWMGLLFCATLLCLRRFTVIVTTCILEFKSCTWAALIVLMLWGLRPLQIK